MVGPPYHVSVTLPPPESPWTSRRLNQILMRLEANGFRWWIFMYWSKRAVVPAGARAGHPVSWYWCQEFPVVEAIGPTECLCQDCETGRRRVRQEGWKPPVDIYGRPALCSHPCWKIVRD